MLNLKIFILLVIFIRFSNLLIAKAEYGECNRITIEGGEQALMKIFHDFNELKNAMNNLKDKTEFDQQIINETTQNAISIIDERIDEIPVKCYRKSPPKDCASATVCTKRSGIYKIKLEKYSTDPFYVSCDDETEKGDWLIIQKRQDGSEDFYRNWEDYEKGFGDIDGEFFIGLKKLHALTNFNGPQELLIIMEDVNATKVYAKYDAFAIGNESESYKLKRLGKYSGTAGDSLIYHLGMNFTTKDRDNDLDPTKNCAVAYTGGWWYNYCHKSNLNGKFGENNTKGLIWYAFRGHGISLNYVKMMIRRSLVI